jgi:hypothetical protein
MPRLAIVAVQPGVRPGIRQQAVDPVRGGIHVSGGDRGEYRPQFGGDIPQLGRFPPGHLAGGRLAGPQRRGRGGRQGVPIQRWIWMPSFLARRELVDEADRHRHHDVQMTVEIHLTSYVLAT